MASFWDKGGTIINPTLLIHPWNFRQFYVYAQNLEIEHKFQSSDWPILQ